MFTATVVREYSESESTVTPTYQEALDWMATKGLYLVEEGRLEADSPTPTEAELIRFAGYFGWEISINPVSAP